MLIRYKDILISKFKWFKCNNLNLVAIKYLIKIAIIKKSVPSKDKIELSKKTLEKSAITYPIIKSLKNSHNVFSFFNLNI